ncbi:MarR family winged helix-turn-helix transcriptional regulator [Parapedobacter sp. 10938]|uniref:MarR family winged helix-turn-helix transcriptional regulator n=1 Tax=Parapedobacter flavus TaxID=3110225 RepID=UPI002DB6E619|nr:MarR family transcriptional regulator [Parapedobacter sp. 10938]MEC3880886.1 MarR family transcriptional regulator [Parapedobacter sp. 10938]
MQTEHYNAYSFLLERTARRVKQYAQYQFNCREFGITVDQWSILKNLNQHADLSQKELAEYCGKDQPTLTRIVDLLVQKNLVERRANPSDRRSFVVHLTPAGEQKINTLANHVGEIRMQAWKNLDDTDFEHLKRILNMIYDNLEV